MIGRGGGSGKERERAKEERHHSQISNNFMMHVNCTNTCTIFISLITENFLCHMTSQCITIYQYVIIKVKETTAIFAILLLILGNIHIILVHIL